MSEKKYQAPLASAASKSHRVPSNLSPTSASSSSSSSSSKNFLISSSTGNRTTAKPITTKPPSSVSSSINNSGNMKSRTPTVTALNPPVSWNSKRSINNTPTPKASDAPSVQLSSSSSSLRFLPAKSSFSSSFASSASASSLSQQKELVQHSPESISGATANSTLDPEVHALSSTTSIEENELRTTSFNGEDDNDDNMNNEDEFLSQNLFSEQDINNTSFENFLSSSPLTSSQQAPSSSTFVKPVLVPQESSASSSISGLRFQSPSRNSNNSSHLSDSSSDLLFNNNNYSSPSRSNTSSSSQRPNSPAAIKNWLNKVQLAQKTIKKLREAADSFVMSPSHQSLSLQNLNSSFHSSSSSSLSPGNILATGVAAITASTGNPAVTSPDALAPASVSSSASPSLSTASSSNSRNINSNSNNIEYWDNIVSDLLECLKSVIDSKMLTQYEKLQHLENKIIHIETSYIAGPSSSTSSSSPLNNSTTTASASFNKLTEDLCSRVDELEKDGSNSIEKISWLEKEKLATLDTKIQELESKFKSLVDSEEDVSSSSSSKKHHKKMIEDSLNQTIQGVEKKVETIEKSLRDLSQSNKSAIDDIKSKLNNNHASSPSSSDSPSSQEKLEKMKQDIEERLKRSSQGESKQIENRLANQLKEKFDALENEQKNSSQRILSSVSKEIEEKKKEYEGFLQERINESIEKMNSSLQEKINMSVEEMEKKMNTSMQELLSKSSTSSATSNNNDPSSSILNTSAIAATSSFNSSMLAADTSLFEKIKDLEKTVKKGSEEIQHLSDSTREIMELKKEVVELKKSKSPIKKNQKREQEPEAGSSRILEEDALEKKRLNEIESNIRKQNEEIVGIKEKVENNISETNQVKTRLEKNEKQVQDLDSKTQDLDELNETLQREIEKINESQSKLNESIASEVAKKSPTKDTVDPKLKLRVENLEKKLAVPKKEESSSSKVFSILSLLTIFALIVSYFWLVSNEEREGLLPN